jgi:isocitrate/isopropylmalate dehydrogenase
MPVGGAAMDEELTKFADLIAEADRAVMMLDEFTMHDSAKAIARAVRDGKSVYAGLLEHRNTIRMTDAESAQFQEALDLLRARLRFFGEAA